MCLDKFSIKNILFNLFELKESNMTIDYNRITKCFFDSTVYPDLITILGFCGFCLKISNFRNYFQKKNKTSGCKTISIPSLDK